VCAHVRPCGWAGSWASECALARVAYLSSMQSACAIFLFVAFLAALCFSTLSHKRHDLRKKKSF
jgi:hypothetical protein